MGVHDRLRAAHAARKRDVQGMAQTLADLGDETVVRVLFAEDRYGLFEYAGVPTGLRDGSRVLAGRPFDNAAGKPTASLRAVEVVDGDLDESEGDEVAATVIEHGDLVTATITHDLYGDVVVSGVALQNPEGTRTLVGEWIVADEGEPASRLASARRVAPAGEHDVPVPPRLARVELDVAD